MTAPFRPAPLGPFPAGVNNRLPPTQLEQRNASGKQTFLRHAVNADITEAGTLKRRLGYTRVIDATKAHSLWGDEDGSAFFVDNGTLYALSAAAVPTAVRGGLDPAAPVSYASPGDGSTYYSNGAAIGRVQGAADFSVGVPRLSPEPGVSGLSGGSLPAGVYLVCLTAVNQATGEESGSTVPVQVEVPANGKITISNIPAGYARIYMSPVNSDLLLSTGTAQNYSAGATTSITVIPTLGGRCQTVLMQQMPPGNIVRAFNGRLLVASGTVLFYSEPYAFGLYNPAKGYIPFPEVISVLEPCGGGVFIVADKTYWLPDPIDDSQLSVKSPYAGYARSSARSPDTTDVWWMSPNGYVVAHEDGSVEYPQDKTIGVPTAKAGATLYRDADGMKRVTSTLFGTGPDVAAAGSFMEAEIVRKETVL